MNPSPVVHDTFVIERLLSAPVDLVFQALTDPELVTNERLVYVYEMTVNGRKISASLATFQLFPDGAKTRLVLTEQGAYFHDPEMSTYAAEGPAKSRLAGTQGLMDQLAALIAR